MSFRYFDKEGVELSDAADPSRILRVTIVARGETAKPIRGDGFKSGSSGTYADSSSVIVALRNAQ